jgi:uncharacterized OsmC-like protein
MSGNVQVSHKEGDLFEIAVRDHRVYVDQPKEAGGTDAAPTPVELFVASLASCVAHYVRGYLARHRLPTKGMTVGAEFTMADRPARVGEINVSIDLPEGVPNERRAALLAVASHCTVHNTLDDPPAVSIDLASGARQAADRIAAA